MKKGLFLVLLLIVVALVPMGVKKYVNENIQERVSVFKQRGIDVKMSNEKGYFSSIRDFELTITDEKKFAAYLSSLSSDMKFISSFIFGTAGGKDLFKGLVFKGNIENSNINYFSDIKANIYLAKLPSKIMERISKDKTNPLYKALEKKLINFDMLFSNKGVFKQSNLRNIDETFTPKDDRGSLIVKVLGQEVKNNSDDKKIKIKDTLDKFFFDLFTGHNKIAGGFENLEHTYDGQDKFLADASLSIKNILFKDDEKVIFKINSIYNTSSGKVEDDNYTVNGKFKLSDLLFQGKRAYEVLILKDLKIDLDILDIHYPSLKTFMNVYQENEMILMKYMNYEISRVEYSRKAAEYQKQVVEKVFSLINKGLKIKVDASLDDFFFQTTKIKSLDIDLDAKLKENNINLSMKTPMELLAFVEVDGKIVVDEKGFETISNTSGGMLGMFLANYIKKDGKNLIFDIKFKDGKLNINNKEFALR